jgi:hypothetical protein
MMLMDRTCASIARARLSRKAWCQVHMPAHLAAIRFRPHAWSANQGDQPSRAEAIRRLRRTGAEGEGVISAIYLPIAFLHSDIK